MGLADIVAVETVNVVLVSSSATAVLATSSSFNSKIESADKISSLKELRVSGEPFSLFVREEQRVGTS